MADPDPAPRDETLLEVHGAGAPTPPTVPPPDAVADGVPPTVPSAPPPAAGTRLGPYELGAELGRGGMGVVFRAYRPDLKRHYALKIILPGAGGAPGAAAELIGRFRREAQAAAGLAGRPGIVGVHDIGEADGRHYFAMDLIEGRSLEALVDGAPASDAAALTPQRAAALVEQAAAAVHFAHTRGILHRDLKPANILVDGEGRPWVADFGLATLRDADAQSARLTKSGAVLGTPAYMPPEQARGDALDVRADVYALGATLYEALVGEPPFTGESVYSVLAKVMRDEPRPPIKRNPFVPRDLDTIVLKCLEKDRERRYASAADLAEDLRRWREHEAIAARPLTAVERLRRRVRRNPAPWAVGSILSAVLIGLLLNVWFRSLKAEARRTARATEITEQAEAAEAQDAWQAAAFLWLRGAEVLGEDTTAGAQARARADAAQAAADRAALIASAAKLLEIGQAQCDLHATILQRVQQFEAADTARRLQGEDPDPETVAALADGRRVLDGAYMAAAAAMNGARVVLEPYPDAAGHTQALTALAAMAWARLEHAEATGRDADARRFHHDLESLEDALAGRGRSLYADRLRGDGTLTLDTTPSGATVECRRFRATADGRLADVPYDPRARAFGVGTLVLGRTPLRRVPLPMGSYLLVLRHPGTRDTRYPVWIERGEDDVVAAPVPLYTDAEIGDGFVYVPGGDTWLGGASDAINPWPRHRCTVGGFALAEREVTMAEYRDFLADQLQRGALSPDAVQQMVPREAARSGLFWRVTPAGLNMPPAWARWPVFGISWTDARAYCAWIGARQGRTVDLPTEAEWVRAARGADGRAFVWGAGFDWAWTSGVRNPRFADGLRHPAPVLSVEDDVSLFGVRDLAGGIREWCRDAPVDSPGTRSERGGAWGNQQPSFFRVASRFADSPDVATSVTGFRLRAELPTR